MTRGLIVIAAGLLAGGCDLVFSPGGQSIDATSSPFDGRVDATDPDLPDGPDASRIDADPADAAVCSATCYDPTGASANPVACTGVHDYCSDVADYLDQVDLCDCTQGQPMLYLVNPTGTPGTATAVMFTTDVITHNTLLAGSCILAVSDSCPMFDCGVGPRFIRVWENVPISSGLNSFEIHGDSGCTSPTLTFEITL